MQDVTLDVIALAGGLALRGTAFGGSAFRGSAFRCPAFAEPVSLDVAFARPLDVTL